MDTQYDYLVISTEVDDEPADYQVRPPVDRTGHDNLTGALVDFLHADAPTDLPTGAELVIRVRPVRVGGTLRK